MRDAIRGLGERRGEVRVAIQLEARTAEAARRELDDVLENLKTDYIDVATYYYVEHPDEWREIISPGGAAEVLEEARADGRVRAIGLTSHQRPLAATAAATGRLDLLMIRYNAAHRGAERDVFPIVEKYDVPVVAFTCMRWGALLDRTPDDPPEFAPPRAADWYRFVLGEPRVAVALMAPDGRAELLENLALLDDWRGLSNAEYAILAAHGDRVRRHADGFP
jgi:predicted aldo/keto reductase-like oxidoreductase